MPGPSSITAQGRTSGLRARTSFLVRTNWPQFHRGPFRHGYAPYENVLDFSIVSRLQLLWSRSTGQSVNHAMQSSPVVANGLVYAVWSSPSDGRLMAFDAATGALRWSKPIGYTYGCSATPAVAYGRVYVPSSNRTAAFDARTGALRWRAGETTCGGTPTAANGRIFVVDNNNVSVEARDPINGKLIWRRNVCVPTPAGCSSSSIYAPLAVADGVVYVANVAGAVVAYAASDGRRLWSNVVAPGVTIDAAPVVEEDVVYISAHDGRLYALNRHDGSVLWSTPIGASSHATPAFANGVLYVGSDERGLSAIDARTGALLWNHGALGAVRTSPAVANGVVYVGAAFGRVYALQASTGSVNFNRQVAPEGRILSPSPAVVDGVLYVGTGDRLLAFGLVLSSSSNAAR
jgi:outer membrane protein assembly factor BamB